jgi:alpha-glucoside transport system permease protein
MNWMSVVWGLAAIVGVPLTLGGYIYSIEFVLDRLGVRKRDALRPWLWLAPALLFLGGLLIYPVFQTAILSFKDASSTAFVGLKNYRYIFTDKNMIAVLWNNLRWLVVFPTVTVIIGLIIAVLADRVKYEKVLKSAIFMPAAISFAVAGVIWRFMYQYQPEGMAQIGTVNAFFSTISSSFQPRAWLFDKSLNNWALIAAVVWIQAGYAMVLFSASLRSIPESLIEAARIEGASEFQIFFKVILPLMKSTVVVVITTYVITALKVFDFVYVMTNGTLGTDVIANRMYKEMFINNNFGRASAFAVILLVTIIPIVVMNIRSFGKKAGSV